MNDLKQKPRNDELEGNPGIGQSEGTFATGEDPEEIAGENTVLGDVDIDSTSNDGVPAGRSRPHEQVDA